MVDLFMKYPLHLKHLIEKQQNQFATDGYNQLYVAKNLNVDKIQSTFESNSIMLKQRQRL